MNVLSQDLQVYGSVVMVTSLGFVMTLLFRSNVACSSSSTCEVCLASGSCVKCKENFALKPWTFLGKVTFGINTCDRNCETFVELISSAKVCNPSQGNNCNHAGDKKSVPT